MSFDLNKLKIMARKPEGPRMVLLKDVTDGIYPQFYVDGYPEVVPDRPGCECPFCEKRRAQGLPERQRYLVPIIDQADHQRKMLSITELGMRTIRELMAKYMDAQETERMIKAQRDRAASFKYSKMLYGARR